MESFLSYAREVKSQGGTDEVLTHKYSFYYGKKLLFMGTLFEAMGFFVGKGWISSNRYIILDASAYDVKIEV